MALLFTVRYPQMNSFDDEKGHKNHSDWRPFTILSTVSSSASGRTFGNKVVPNYVRSRFTKLFYCDPQISHISNPELL